MRKKRSPKKAKSRQKAKKPAVASIGKASATRSNEKSITIAGRINPTNSVALKASKTSDKTAEPKNELLDKEAHFFSQSLLKRRLWLAALKMQIEKRLKNISGTPKTALSQNTSSFSSSIFIIYGRRLSRMTAAVSPRRIKVHGNVLLFSFSESFIYITAIVLT